MQTLNRLLEMARMQAVVYIGDRLKALRIEHALTQAELAEKAGVNTVTVARLERNETEPHMPTVRKLAAALEVHPRALTKGDTDA
jgi:transcriptional regulator with XRE-family HTH domain